MSRLPRVLLGFILVCFFAALPAKAANYEDSITVDHQSSTVMMTEITRNDIAGDGLVTIMNQAGSEPVYENEAIIGFRLFEIDAGSIYDLVGLQDGDVVTQIDDVPLADAKTAMNMLKYVRGESTFTYTVRRMNGPLLRYVVKIT